MGGVVGGLAVALAVGVGLYLAIRRRRRTHARHPGPRGSVDSVQNPFAIPLSKDQPVPSSARASSTDSGPKMVSTPFGATELQQVNLSVRAQASVNHDHVVKADEFHADATGYHPL